MNGKVFNFEINLDWNILKLLSQIDRFDAEWATIEKREGQSLKQLKDIATIESVGASTRIEGSSLSNAEIEVLLEKIDITNISDRNSQEVVGYFNVLDMIHETYEEIEISEFNIKGLHNILLKLSSKDTWHRGNFKQLTNAVEARFPDGRKQIIFRTSEPGVETEELMKNLIEWNNVEKEAHPLIISAAFTYELLSVHPFQDGNGRLSRLITNLLLLKFGYKWIEYVSFEHEIEQNKKEYYKTLRTCQALRPNENITEWIYFFLKSLLSIKEKLQVKLELSGIESKLTPKEKSILTIIGANPGSKSGEISEKLGIPSPTIKRILGILKRKNLIVVHGKGPGTNYTIS